MITLLLTENCQRKIKIGNSFGKIAMIYVYVKALPRVLYKK